MKKDYTLQEVFSTPQFDELYYKELAEIHNKRTSIQQKDLSVEFKASPYSSLRNRGMLRPDYMKNEVLLIIAKKSNQSAVNREWIEDFMREIVAKTLKALEPKEAPVKPKTKKANPKKKTAKKPSVKKQKIEQKV